MLTQKPDEFKLWLPILLLVFIIVSSIFTFSVTVFVMQIMLATITIPIIMKKNYKTAVLYIIIFAVSLCFVFLVYHGNEMKYGTPYYIGGSDDLMFEGQGLDIFYANIYNPQEVLDLGVIDVWSKHSFFVVYISMLIRIANLFDGYTTFLPRIMNVYFLLWICMILEYLFKKYAFFSDNKAYLSIAFFALTPNIQYINAHVFRDTLNLLQILLIAFLFDKLLNNEKYIRKIFFLASIFFLVYITFYTRPSAVIFAGAISLFLLAEKLKLKKIYFLIPFLPIVFMSEFVPIADFSRYAEVYNDYNLNSAGEGLSAYVFSQPILPFGIIFRAFYALITPFPNFFGLFQDFSTIIFDFVCFLIYGGVIIFAVFIPLMLKRLIKLDWLVFSFLILFFSVIGTTFTFRHIMLYYPFLVAIAVDGYQTSSRKGRVYTLAFSEFLGVSLALIYVFLKNL